MGKQCVRIWERPNTYQRELLCRSLEHVLSSVRFVRKRDLSFQLATVLLADLGHPAVGFADRGVRFFVVQKLLVQESRALGEQCLFRSYFFPPLREVPARFCDLNVPSLHAFNNILPLSYHVLAFPV